MAEARDQRLSIIHEDDIELAPLYSMDSSLCLYTLEFPRQNLFQTDCKCQHISVHTVTQSSPSPVLSCVEKPPKHAHVSLIPVANSDTNSCCQPAASNTLQDIHVSARLMDNFLELARENTEKDLETCGVLGAFLEKGTYYVTTLIIPKQKSTSNSCEAIKEEEFFAIQNEHSLFPVGWIHTHPSQSCFMSSIDLHTQYSYQIMIPEAIAIVMAPTDSSRSYGIFRLSDPDGMDVLKECQETGFHTHSEPANGSPIYEHCSNVYTNSNLRFEIFDLR
ncbi:hypothetical protein GH714_023274 [Hevea brasiliensis]|uniref:MPN domain-containing protein n=1 Tax=Hevea brasiliensis TaxID=3981 RepID=A0A6A6KCM0_HEVBR|nr:AMSH-like ubiquitin thioesterase 2 isoform X1 [Hevea brasiliensis]KAF2286645.1 hypothetical protein GH714_023195 [Hevea brasiliensis]KAF2286660.1 hypothetical protein GH714_023274 [Hevea brasiliensis]